MFLKFKHVIGSRQEAIAKRSLKYELPLLRMKILHVCVSGPFTDGMSYQENELVAQHVALGHEVSVVASTEVFDTYKKVVKTASGISRLDCGATLYRLGYAWRLFGWLATKIRAHQGLGELLASIRPDRIMFHGLTAWDLLTVASYVRRNPKVKLFADCHEDFNNSAMTWASRELLHKRFYKPIFRRCIHQISEVLCVTVESLDFAINFYGSDRAKTRMYPLGGVIEPATVNARRRADFRSRLGFTDADLVITQTGKLDRTKRLDLALRAFRANPSPRLKLVIAGRMTDEVKAKCLPLIEADTRIIDLGWQSTEELRSVLAGADFFLQPFGQTVTTQMAMCHGCVVLAQDLPSHRWLIGDNGKLFKDARELDITFRWVIENQEKVEQLRQASRHFAEANLDYRKLAFQIVA
jgi:glycosyltransferase involved in cell wall biosynthesis